MSRTLFAALWALPAACSPAFPATEPPNLEWNRTFGGSDHEWGAFVLETSDGGYIAAGATMSYGAGYFDAYLVKTDPAGNPEWSKTFGGDDNDEATSVLEIAGGSYIVSGTTASKGPGFHNMYLLKIDGAGNEIWSRAYGGDGYDHAAAVVAARDGGYAMAGFTESFGAPGRNMFVVKTDAEGNEVWSAAFGGEEEDAARTIQETMDGGFIIAGYSRSPLSEKPLLYIVKTDGQGGEVWSRIYEGYGEGISIRELPAGGYAVTGTSDWGSSAFVLTIDGSGAELSSQRFEGFDHVQDFKGLPGGGTLILASIYIHERDGSVSFLWQLDAQGNVLWSLELDGRALEMTRDGGSIVVGGAGDLSLVKFGPLTAAFRRGRVNGDGVLDIADAVCILGYLFSLSGEACEEGVLSCLDAADSNDDGGVDISDPIAILASLFLGAGPLPEPTLTCGHDMTPDDLRCLRASNCP